MPAVITAFAPRFSTNAGGDILFVANTLLTAPSSDPNAAAARNGTGAVLNNNNFGMVYVDADADATTFNSSLADLALPSGATVLFAGLYWGANSASGSRNQALLRTPASSSYSTLTGQVIGAESGGNYQSFADVTSQVRSAGAGTYAVANVQASTGADRHAGWSIVVVYGDPAAPPRNLTVFDGLAVVNASTPNVTIPISGFTAPPTGSVNASIGFVTYEGDLGSTGDSVKLNGTTLSDALNPASNFFNSTIGRRGARVATKSPDYVNQLGFDADVVGTSGVIPNGATSATIALTTGGETYLPGVVTTAIDLYAPVVSAAKTVVDVNGGQVEPGDVLEYTAAVQVTSGEAATRVVLLDPIPAFTSFVPGSLQIVAGANAGPQSDAAGDDRAEFDPANNRIAFRLGTGATATDGGTLAVGGSATIRFRVLVSPSTPDGVAISNQAGVTFTGQATGASLSAATTLATATVRRRSDLVLGQSVDAAAPNVGDVVTFTVTLGNNGPFANSGVRVGDLLPSGLAFVSSSPSLGSYDPASGVWTVGAVPVGASAALAIRARVVSSTQSSNTASIGAADLPDPDSANNSASAIVTPRRSDLVLSATVGNPRPNVGERVTFTTTLANVGPDAATGVSISDALPSGFALVSALPSQGAYDAGTGAWTVGGLASGGSATLTLTADVTSPDPSLAYVAVAAADQFDPIVGNNVATVPVTPRRADLALSTGVDNAQPNVGDVITYTVTLTNNGPDGASGVVVGDSGFPSGVQLVSVTLSQGTYDPVASRWTVGAVASGSSATLVARARVTAPTVSPQAVTILASDQFDPVPANNSSRTPVDPQESALSVAIQAGDPRPEVGEAVTITVNLRNDGPSPATGVAVANALPAGLAFVSASPGRGSYDPATGLWTLGGIGVGEVVPLILVVTVAGPDPATVSATIAAADQFDSNPSDNGASITLVPRHADLYLTLDNDAARPNVGDLVTLTLTLNNLGPDPATGVRVAVVLPAGLTLLSASPSRGSVAPGSGIWDVGTVDLLSPLGLVLVVRVDSADPQAASATVLAGDQYDPDPANNGLMTLLVPQRADLSLAQEADVPRPNVGDVVTFTVIVTNSGPDAATGVRISDPLPAGLSFVSATPGQGSYDPATGAWDVGTLGGMAQQTLVIRARVAAPDLATLSATIAAADQFDPDGADNSASATVAPRRANLALDVAISDPSPNVGDLVTLALTLGNSGPDAASGVAVRDLLPAGLALVASTPSQGAYDPSTGLWSVGPVAAGSSAGLILVARVDAPGAFTNSAVVASADQFDPDPGDNADSVSATPQAVDLGVTKTVDVVRPNVGEIVTFTIVLTNDGPSTATGVLLRSPAGAGLTVVSSQASRGIYDPATGLWDVGEVAPMGSQVLRVAARVDSPNVVASAASLAAHDQFDTDPGNDASSVGLTPQVADLALDLRVDDPRPNVGQFVTYTITLGNVGPDPATGATVRDALPSGLQFVSSSASRGSYDPTTGLWSIGAVAPGSPQVLQITARVASAGSAINAASIASADQFDPDRSNDLATAASDPQQADLALASSVDAARPNVGDLVTVAYTLANEGPGGATGVSVAAPLPAGLEFVSASPGSGTYDPSTGAWVVGEVAAGVTRTLRVSARVTDAASATLSATIAAADQFDPDGADNSASVRVVPQRADLALSAAVDLARPNVGDVVTYSVTLRNAGPDAATGVRVLDVLPAGLTFLGASGPGAYDPVAGLWEVGTVTPGGPATLAIRARVDGPSPRTMTATVASADQFDPAPLDNSASIGISPTRADLSLAVTVDDPRPNVGDRVTFTLTVTNAGPDPATGVRISDPLPPGLGLDAADPSLGLYSQITGIWELGQIDPGSSATLTLLATVLSPDPATNAAAILASAQFDPTAADNASSVLVTPRRADLSLSAAVDVARPNVGDVVTFTLTLANSGPDAATGVRVADLVPSGFDLLSATPGTGAYDPATGEWQVGTVPAGGSSSLSVTARVTAPNPAAKVATIVASAQFDPDPADNSATVAVAPQVADLALAASVDAANPDVGDVVTFAVALTNAGADPASGVSVGALLPSGYTLVSASPGTGIYDPGTGIWTVGALGAGARATLALRARIDAVAPPRVSAAIVSADQFDPNASDNAASAGVAPRRVDLGVAVVVDDPRPNVGDTLTYTIYLSNVGPDAATGVSVLDLLPAGVTFASASASQGSYDPATGLWNVGLVAPGSEATLAISATVTAPDEVINRVAVASVDQFDTYDANDSAETSSAAQQAELRLLGGVDLTRPNVGDTVTYLLFLENLGSDPATGIVVTAPLPPGWNLASASPGTGAYDPVAGTWTVAGLAPGSTTTLVLTAVVAAPDVAALVAMVRRADQFDPNLGDNRLESWVVPLRADLDLSEGVDSPRPNVGDTVTFTLTIRNEGPDDATGVAVAAPLPPGLAFAAALTGVGSYDPASGTWQVGTVPAGASAVLSLTAIVVAPSPSAILAGVAAADQFDPDPSNDTASASVRPRSSDLGLALAVDDPRPNVGDVVTFVVTLSNDGPDAASAIRVSSLLPAGLALVIAEPSRGTYDPATGLWSLDFVASGSVGVLTLRATVVSPLSQAVAVGLVGADQFDPDPSRDVASATVTPQVADLAASLTVDSPRPNVGDVITFTASITNGGPDASGGLVALELLPDGLTFVGADSDQGAYSPSSGIWAVGAIAPGATLSLRVRARVDSSSPQADILAIVAADQFDPDASNNSAGLAITPQVADLALSAEVDDPRPDVGDLVTATITLADNGPDLATGVRVVVTLGSGLTLVSAEPSAGTYDAALGSWNVGSVGPSTPRTLRLVARVTSPAAATVQAAIASADQFQAVVADDRASAAVTPRQVDLGLSQAVDVVTPNAGEIITFAVTVSNAGPDAATGVRVLDLLPAGLALLAADPSQGTYDPSTGLWQVGAVAPGARPTLVLRARAVSASPSLNTAAVVAADQFDPTPGDRASAAVFPRQAGLALGHVVDDASPRVGDEVAFAVTVSNAGPDAATGVRVLDLLPAGLALVAADPSQGLYDPSTGLWQVGALTPGATATLLLRARVASAAPAAVTASLSAADQFDPSTPDNVASVSIVPKANAAPVGGADGYSTSEDAPLVVAAPGLLANDGDPDLDPLTAVLVSGPSHGTLALGAEGSFSYTPDADYHGPDTFTYRPFDGELSGAPITVALVVGEVDDAPAGAADAYSTSEDAPLTVAAGSGVLANDRDADGDALVAVLVSGPSHGTLVLNPDGSFVYTPGPGYSGTDSFVYRASDGTNLGGKTTVALAVAAVADPATAIGDSYVSEPGRPLVVPASRGVLANDSGADRRSLTAVLVSGPSHGTLVLNPDGSFTYTPDPGYSGTDSFVYRASDGRAFGIPSAVLLAVGSAEAPPRVVRMERYGYHLQPTRVVLTFDSDLDPGPARALSSYAVVKAGRDGRLGTRDDRVASLKSAGYNAATRSVILTPRERLPLRRPYRVIVRPSALRGLGGAVLDGDGDGNPGGAFAGRLGRSSLAGRSGQAPSPEAPASIRPRAAANPGSIDPGARPRLPSARLAARFHARSARPGR